MVKVIDIIENDSITGIKYGLKEVDEPVVEISHASNAYKRATQNVKKQKVHNHQKTK